MAEKRTIELEVNSNLGNLKQQLKAAQVEVQTLSEKFGATSVQAVEAAKAAAILKDKIGDAKALTDAFNPDAKFKALSGSLTGVAGGFSVVTGAMGAFGTQSEDVEKALLKVQSAMALSSGLQAIGESVDSFKQLGAVVTNFGSKAVASFRAMTAANKVFMITGIGVLLVALGAVVAYWDDISKALGFTTKESEKYAKQQKLITEQAKEQRAEIAKESGAFTQQILRLKNTNAGTKERRDLINEVNKTYGTTLKNLSDETKFQASLNVELASYLEYQKAKYQLQKNEKAIVANLEKQDELNMKLIQSQKNLNKAVKEGANEKKKAKVDIEDKFSQDVLINEEATKIADDERENIIKLKKEIDSAKTRFLSYGSAANTASAAIATLTNSGKKFVQGSGQTNEKVKNEKDNVDKIKGINDDLVAYYDAIEQERQAKITDAREKELQEAANKYDDFTLLADKAGQSTTQIDENYRTQRREINKKFDDLDQIAKDEKASKEKERLASEKSFLDSITLTENQLKLQKLEEQYLAESILYKDNKEILAALDKKYLKDKEDLTKETNEKIAQSDKEAAEKKQALLNSQLDAVKQGLSSISNIAELFAGKSKKSQKRAFDVQKATNIATATIDTFMSAQSAYKSLVGVPVVGPVIAPLAAAGAIAAGLINIKKIKATQFEGGTPPTDSSVPTAQTGGEPQAPQFNVVGNNGMNQLAQLQQKPIQAYVVSSEMTSAQSLERNRINNATI